MDINSVHKTLNSASKGFATTENANAFFRGMQYKNKKSHWSWQPPKQKSRLICKDTKGRYISG